MLSERGREVAPTIEQGRPVGEAALPAPRGWTDHDLAVADARIVAELERRVEILTSLTASGDEQTSGRELRPDLSKQTVRELLAVVEILTRREAARLAGHRRRTSD